MNVNILHLIEGARNARGLTVIIDVFRAFSTTCYAFEQGIQKIYPVGDLNEALAIKQSHPDYLLVGERNEQKPAGFDFGNSPTHILSQSIEEKIMVHTTSSGTQGIVNASGATEIITGSFVNAGAIVSYIKSRKPKTVSLVCMGYACEYPTDEDTLCATYLKNELQGEGNNFPEMIEQIRKGDGARFFDPEKQQWAPENDFKLCLDLNRFDFVLKVEKEGELYYLRKIEV